MVSKGFRYTIYFIIVLVCILSIGVAVYFQFFRDENRLGGYTNEILVDKNQNIITGQDMNDSFTDLFTDEFYSNSFDDSNIQKIDSEKELVYTAYSSNESVEGKYSIDVNIPVINIQNDVVQKYNEITQNIFVNKINDIMLNGKSYTIYNLDYISYINENILSLAIRATIKEGEDLQRVVVQTYNYNLETGKDVKLQDLLTNRDINNEVVENKINLTIKKASEDAEKMAELGYKVYQRNIEDEMYKIENINNFIQGPSGELYIIFAYGNNNYTSEIDVVEI